MSGASLEAKGLVAGFGAATVLHGVDLSVAPGEVAAVLGLNGAGKSVTLKVLAGLVPARAGRVELDGEDVSDLTPEERVGRGMGHVLQGRHVFGELNVEQNLRLGAYLLRRRDSAAYAPALDEVFSRFPRLAERREQRAGSLSGGEQAMLAVGRALMGGPRIVLIDEPTAGLSPRAAEELLTTLATTRETGVTMLLVEQNTRFALELADRILIMRRGVVVNDTPAEDLDTSDLASQLGIGRILTAQFGGRGQQQPGAKKKAPAKKAAAKKAPAKKAAAKKKAPIKKKAPPKKTATKKAAAKKTATKKAPGKKAGAKKAGARKRPAR